MRLLSMDVDRPGSDGSVRVGQFSPGLNTILGPTGSGKSTLLRWLRCIAEESQTANSSSSTKIGSAPIAGVLHLRNRASHYRVTTDRNGKIRFDLAQDSDDSYQRDYQMRWDGRLDGELSGCDFSPTQRAAFVGLAAAHDRYDTEVALEQLAERLGLDNEFVPSDRREQVFAAQQKIRAQLEQLGPLHSDRDTLLAQQRELEAELQATTGQSQKLRCDGLDTEQLRLDRRLALLEAKLQNKLREIEVLEQQMGVKRSELKLLEVNASAVTVGESYRVQLQKLDDRLHRWRQTLKDLKTHRETIDNEATDLRLDKQVGDQLNASKEPDPRAAMRSLEAQIQSTRRQLDVLVQRYDEIPGYDYRSASPSVAGTGLNPSEVPQAQGVFRDGTGRTFEGHSAYWPDAGMLPETLRSMQKDLREICQKLSRQEAQTTGESLRHQSTQLQRCETELLEAVEQLIEQRGELLRTISAEQNLPVEQLTLAFGDWCQCSDHPHLMDWLLSEESNQPTQKSGVDPALRQTLLDEIAGLKESQKQAKLDADLCRRQLEEAQTLRRGVVAQSAPPKQQSTVELRSELHRIAVELAKLAERDRLTAELNELTHQLTRTSAGAGVASSAFREVINRHITGLMAHAATTRPSDSQVQGRYDSVDGFSRSQAIGSNSPVPSEIVRIAMRLAIAELLARKGEPISLVVDNALEAIAPYVQNSAVTYLAKVSRTQQIVLLTSSQFVAERVRHHQGWVGNLFCLATRTGVDMNAQLAAVANHEEAEKWYRPMITPVDRASGNRCYLTYSSLVEDLPAIDPDLTARCRSLGVDRIGDLLDVDALWLADQIRVEGVSRNTVEAWQSVAQLLCNVPKLRPFDARVMVGAGIRSSRELAETPPQGLLDRIEDFLATARGRKILHSGSSKELSRLTSWIASAKGQGGVDGYWTRSDSSNRSYRRSSDSRRSGDRSYSVIDRDGSRLNDRRDYKGSEWELRSTRTRARRRSRDCDSNSDLRSERSSCSSENRTSSGSRNSIRPNGHSESAAAQGREGSEANPVAEVQKPLRYYLELESPVVDAPSIGPRMAERLEPCQVETVSELLAADAEDLAERLGHRRVDAEAVEAWQHQANLVCRIPNLRGHDAQLLVACDLTTPEQLCDLSPEYVLSEVTAVAESKVGQRILRGSEAPDLQEVTDWINWAGESRQLDAA
ncbi:MAG: DUF4332 domain-containing protein [Planctomycetota bacterium]|nr:DUF4332 domain-containing protein [Planctomycetota bacterium]